MIGVTVITTGGTIDKIYGQGVGVRDLTIGPPVILDLFKKMQLSGLCSFELNELMQKDSLDLETFDRERIADTCRNARSKRIIISHGTDSMIKTAEQIKKSVPDGKTVVLFGSLRPACMIDSDAEFNAGFALAACLYAKPGVYIGMNGLHAWNECRKNPRTGVFEPI